METDRLTELLRLIWCAAEQSPDDVPALRRARVLAAAAIICPSAPAWLAELVVDEVAQQEA